MKELLDMFLTFCQNRRVYLRRRICDAADATERGSQWSHWATDEELMDYSRLVSVHRVSSRSTRRRFVGYKNRGIPGAIAATLGVIAPCLSSL